MGLERLQERPSIEASEIGAEVKGRVSRPEVLKTCAWNESSGSPISETAAHHHADSLLLAGTH